MEIVKNITGCEKEYAYVTAYFVDSEIKNKKYQTTIQKYLSHSALKKDLGEVLPIYTVDEETPHTLYLVSLGEKAKYSLAKLAIVLRNIATKTSDKIIKEN